MYNGLLVGGSVRTPFCKMRVYVQKTLDKQQLQDAIRASGASLTWNLPNPQRTLPFNQFNFEPPVPARQNANVMVAKDPAAPSAALKFQAFLQGGFAAYGAVCSLTS